MKAISPATILRKNLPMTAPGQQFPRRSICLRIADRPANRKKMLTMNIRWKDKGKVTRGRCGFGIRRMYSIRKIIHRHGAASIRVDDTRRRPKVPRVWPNAFIEKTLYTKYLQQQNLPQAPPRHMIIAHHDSV